MDIILYVLISVLNINSKLLPYEFWNFNDERNNDIINFSTAYHIRIDDSENILTPVKYYYSDIIVGDSHVLFVYDISFSIEQDKSGIY